MAQGMSDGSPIKTDSSLKMTMPKNVSSLSDQMSLMVDNIDGIFSLIIDLETALIPVMSPYPSDSAGDSVARPLDELPPHAERLRGINGSMENAIDRLRDLRNRLDV